MEYDPKASSCRPRGGGVREIVLRDGILTKDKPPSKARGITGTALVVDGGRLPDMLIKRLDCDDFL